MMKKLFFFLLMVPFLGFAQGSMDFEGVELSTSYEDGTIEANGVVYNYGHSRDQDEFAIDGQGLMLRRASDSYFEWTVENGMSELTFEYRKAFTGGAPRQLEVLVNGEQVNVSDEFGEGSGEQEEVYTLVTAIDLDGEVTIRIKNVGDATQNRQAVIDNISWTAYEDGENNNGGDLADATCEPSYSTGCDYGDMIRDLTLYGENGTSIEDMENECDDIDGTQDRTDMFDAVDLLPTSEYEIEIVSTTGSDFAAVWIDFNNDGEFDESEKVGQNVNYVSFETSYSGFTQGEPVTIAIPASVEPGVYRMRVVLNWNSTPTDPCGSYSFGNYYDYKVNILEAPNCLRPVNLHVSNITSSEATLSWESVGEETLWDIYVTEDGEEPNDDTEPTFSEVDSDSFLLDELADNTVYSVAVRSNCGGDTSVWTNMLSFSTHCLAADIPFVQDFEGVTVPDLPNCASTEVVSGNSNWVTGYAVTSVPQEFEGNFLYYIYSNEGAADAWYFTQGINLEAGVNYEISYQYGNNSNSYVEKMRVAYGTSASSDAMDNILADHDNITGQTAEEAEVVFSVEEDGVYYFGFQAYSDENQYYLVVDNIVVDLATGCTRPSELAVDNISDNSADLTWQAGADETEWELYVAMSSEDAPSNDAEATHTGITETQFTLTDLEPSSAYSVYVRSVCGEDLVSNWRGPVNFSTNCVPYSVPYFEGFEEGYVDGEEIEGCWGQFNVSGVEWDANDGAKSNGREPHSGNWYASLRYGSTTWLMMDIQLEGDVTYELKFYAKQDIEIGASVEAAFGQTQDVDEMTSIISTTYIGNTWQAVSGEFTPSESGVYTVAILGDLDYAPWYLVIDDISIIEAGSISCAAPEGLGVEEVTETTASVTWEPGMDPEETEGWELAYGLQGFDVDGEDAIILDVQEPLVQLTDLEENTAYDVYVRTVCGEDEYSVWVGPVSFTTLGEVEPVDEYCEGENFEMNYGGMESFETTGALIDISNTDIENTNGYSDFTDIVVKQTAGESFEFAVNIFEDGIFDEAGVAIYIDYNNDFVFDEDERVFTSDNYAAAAYGTITIPADVVDGEYRLRVVSDWLNQNPGACDAGSAIHDYTLLVGEEDVEDCAAPTDIEISDITEDSAVVTWTPGGDEIMWAVLYGEAGFTPNPDEYELALTNTLTLENLEAETDYEVYVMALCDVSDPENPVISDLAGPVSFTTKELGVDNQIFATFTYYPNPVQDQLNLQAGLTIETVQVYNMLGQLVIETSPNALETQINTSGLSSGMYMMNVRIEGNQKAFRIVKK